MQGWSEGVIIDQNEERDQVDLRMDRQTCTVGGKKLNSSCKWGKVLEWERKN